MAASRVVVMPRTWHKIVGCPLHHEGCLAQREEEILGAKKPSVVVSLTFRGPSTNVAQIACARHLETAHGRSLQTALLIATNQEVDVDNDASTDSGDESCRRMRASANDGETSSVGP